MHIKFIFTFLPAFIYAVEFPLEFNGKVFLGKYLNSDTTRFNMDASAQLRCKMVEYKFLSFFMEYRDDLDMAEQKGGVSLDPRYSHYFVTGGFEYDLNKLYTQIVFIHDCVHDIDYEVEGTPVFNRIMLSLANKNYHPSNQILTKQKFLWAFNLRFYPHWRYYGWDINAGADYQYDFNFDGIYKFINQKNFGALLDINLLMCKSDTTFYHQDFFRLATYYKNFNRSIGIELKYNIYNNDPIKNPGGLWLLSAFVEF
jgi:hypothetical protein|uniref:DUF481 domain-containing protein n=1 Tax=candidate division WOR-3 bacterium TaxID=2052148 RepID=A0A7V3RH12_UNCW3